MTKDGIIPPPCADDIYNHGEILCVLDGKSQEVEYWVQLVARIANARVDWNYYVPGAMVLHLGDAESKRRVKCAMYALRYEFDGYFRTPLEPLVSDILSTADEALLLESAFAEKELLAADTTGSVELSDEHRAWAKDEYFRTHTYDPYELVFVLLNTENRRARLFNNALRYEKGWLDRSRDHHMVKGITTRANIAQALGSAAQPILTELARIERAAILVIDGIAQVFALQS